ncbi:MAG: hypothetical protein KDC46_12680 [Thermoleophilia bacterium]|nr:hypothetical protein [Thermoleophilia bacterium]
MLLACAHAVLPAASIAANLAPVEDASPIPASADGHLSLTPQRFDVVEAGDRPLRFELTVTNTTLEPVRIAPKVIALEGSTEPDQFAVPGGRTSASSAAVAWVTFPGFDSPRELASGRKLQFVALVTVPASATPGTYSLGVGASQDISALGVNTTLGPASRVSLEGIVASTVVIDVPGDVSPRIRIRGVSGPRVVWSGSTERFRADVENAGNTLLTIDGQVELGSFLSTAGRTLGAKGPDKGYETLPGGRRELVMVWSDPPLLGWFSPELVVVGGKGSGVRVTKRLDTVYVLPPWWLILLIVIAIALPSWRWRRRRRDPRWQEHRRATAADRVAARKRKAEAKRRAAQARRRR